MFITNLKTILIPDHELIIRFQISQFFPSHKKIAKTSTMEESVLGLEFQVDVRFLS